MGIEKFVEEAAGAFAADKALEAVDPNAGLLAKGAAAIAGFEGAGKLGDFIKDKISASPETGQAPDQSDEQGDDSQA